MHRLCVGCCCAGLLLAAFAARAPAQTLVARYEFNNALNLGLDTSGMGNHATNTAVTQGLDRFSALSAGNFNGSTSVLTKAGGLTGYDGLPGFTFAAWINRSSADGGFSGIVSQDPSGPPCCTNRFLLNASDFPYVDADAHVDFNFGAPGVPNDVWRHLVMTADDSVPGNAVKIYIDGVQAWPTHTFAHDLVNGSLFDTFIGTGENGNQHHFQGLLDDVQIYDGVLSAQQVQLLFQTGSIEIPEPASLAIWGLAGAALALGLVWRRRVK